MKNILKKDWLIWMIILAPISVIVYYWNQFPEQIPTHWNIKGEADDYSSKTYGLLLPVFINLFVYVIFKSLPYIDPKKSNYALFSSKLQIIQLVVHLFISAMAVLTCYISLGYDINIVFAVSVGVVLMMLILGNYLSTLRPNYFVGIRTPWTLANEEVWKKTHRFTGRLWVAASLLMLLAIIALPFSTVVFIVYLSVLILPPLIYSYLLFRKIENNNKHSHI